MFRRCIQSWFVEYETQKVVQIKSWRIGLMFRSAQLSIILYVVVWVMWRERGYQAVDTAVSAVTAKMKGISFVNLSNWPTIPPQVFDAADYVVPAQQNSAFFVLSNLVVTGNQSQGECADSWDTPSCKKDGDCEARKVDMLRGGVMTGRCVPNRRLDGKVKHVCEIYGWCPTEDDRLPNRNGVMLKEVDDFTVLIKNNIEFPRYKVKRRNILEGFEKSYLRTCRYDPTDERNKYCPIFRLGDILKYADMEKKSNRSIWVEGGFMSIHITWSCDLDWNVTACKPTYTFRRLDDVNTPVSGGWNFRYSHIYAEDGVTRRILVKAYGVQFFITVDAKGRKFDPLTFTMNLGSGFALLGLATVICDMIALNITRKRSLYRDAKVDRVKADLVTGISRDGINKSGGGSSRNSSIPMAEFGGNSKPNKKEKKKGGKKHLKKDRLSRPSQCIGSAEKDWDEKSSLNMDGGILKPSTTREENLDEIRLSHDNLWKPPAYNHEPSSTIYRKKSPQIKFPYQRSASGTITTSEMSPSVIFRSYGGSQLWSGGDNHTNAHPPSGSMLTAPTAPAAPTAPTAENADASSLQDVAYLQLASFYNNNQPPRTVFRPPY